jgi:DNA-binding NtrC family response regulator
MVLTQMMTYPYCHKNFKEAMTFHILLVEDFDYVLEFLAEWLRLAGYKVYSAKDADEALACCANCTIDLCLSDVRLPGKSGLALCHEVRKSYGIPVILFTGLYTGGEIAERAQKAGAITVLEKPFSFQELEQQISRALQRERAYA